RKGVCRSGRWCPLRQGGCCLGWLPGNTPPAARAGCRSGLSLCSCAPASWPRRWCTARGSARRRWSSRARTTSWPTSRNRWTSALTGRSSRSCRAPPRLPFRAGAPQEAARRTRHGGARSRHRLQPPQRSAPAARTQAGEAEAAGDGGGRSAPGGRRDAQSDGGEDVLGACKGRSDGADPPAQGYGPECQHPAGAHRRAPVPRAHRRPHRRPGPRDGGAAEGGAADGGGGGREPARGTRACH
ncbi:hypothetical protein T484DRAFT_1892970, partial [Baffinella frigidus]